MQAPTWKASAGIVSMRASRLLFIAALCTAQLFYVARAEATLTQEQRTFAKKPLEKSPKHDTNDSSLLPVHSIDDFKGLTDDQLFQVFTQGVADMPSALQSEKGKDTPVRLPPLARLQQQ